MIFHLLSRIWSYNMQLILKNKNYDGINTIYGHRLS
nr:MAG TPA: hypothetical protein [Bacteriophage sp.]